ncbi:MAG: hypothetical protein RLZZ387_1621 [Chloroflexota bacterium]|jgi:hypothetical protein
MPTLTFFLGALLSHALPTASVLPSMDTFFGEILAWLIGVITVGGGLFLMIDMAKHLFSTPRDLRAAGIDLAVFAVLLAIAKQAPAIATAAAGLIP